VTSEPAVVDAGQRDAIESGAVALARLTRDAVENVSFCARNYLYNSNPTGAQNYRMCVVAATGVFGDQVKKAVHAPDTEVSDAVHLVAVWAEVQVRVASAANADVVATEPQQSAFQNCIGDYDANVTFCNGHYPDGSNGLSTCLNAAQTALGSCLGKIYA